MSEELNLTTEELAEMDAAFEGRVCHSGDR